MARCHDQPRTIMGSHGQTRVTTRRQIRGAPCLWAGRQRVQRVRGYDQTVRSPQKQRENRARARALVVAAEL
eukprot:1017448-Pyramimonas_sp.AAC.1